MENQQGGLLHSQGYVNGIHGTTRTQVSSNKPHDEQHAMTNDRQRCPLQQLLDVQHKVKSDGTHAAGVLEDNQKIVLESRLGFRIGELKGSFLQDTSEDTHIFIAMEGRITSCWFESYIVSLGNADSQTKPQP